MKTKNVKWDFKKKKNVLLLTRVLPLIREHINVLNKKRVKEIPH